MRHEDYRLEYHLMANDHGTRALAKQALHVVGHVATLEIALASPHELASAYQCAH